MPSPLASLINSSRSVICLLLRDGASYKDKAPAENRGLLILLMVAARYSRSMPTHQRFRFELGRAPGGTMPPAQSQLALSQKLRQLCQVPRYMPRFIAREQIALGLIYLFPHC
jgi:hypothetical protein